MDEFAMGSSTENSAYFPARNPVDPTRTPGGSSGGSAVAVAARMTPGALGSDTGGSVRQPAAYTGCVGVKPTYGRVSRYGLIAYASSLDVVGPMATDVRGAARLLEVIAGHDPHDGTSLTAPVDGYEEACGRGVAGLRVGVPEEYFGAGLQPAVKASVEAALRRLEREGATLVPVHLPHTRHAVATYYVLATAEASSNLSRFDGVRFGLRKEPSGGDVSAMYGATRREGFGAEVRRRIVLGTYVLSHGYYDAYYRKAQQVRTLIRRDFDETFAAVDLIATPTAPTVAFLLGEQVDDPLTMYLNDIYTLPASLAGLPALSVPVAPAAVGEGPPLPVGLQLIGPALAEARLFAAAAVVEAG
jgi:aspartyl-tRNA(Asn)/glutamyl-tRNA(Gln) amidotransferase subunit A